MPLIEIVTEPDLRTRRPMPSAFFEHLRATLVWLGVNDGNMEEGSLRCDANVSVRRAGEREARHEGGGEESQLVPLPSPGARYEIDRQIELVEHGGRVDQETRLWDQATSRTIAMRSKEEAHDYRYFPEPDLPPVEMAAARVAEIADDASGTAGGQADATDHRTSVAVRTTPRSSRASARSPTTSNPLSPRCARRRLRRTG